MPAPVTGLSIPTGEAIVGKPEDPGSPRCVRNQRTRFLKKHRETMAMLTTLFKTRAENQKKEPSSFKKLEEELAEFGEHWLSKLEEEHPELAEKYKGMKSLSEKPRLPEAESKTQDPSAPALEELRHELFEALIPKLEINIADIPTTPKSAIHVEKTSKRKQVRFAELPPLDETDPVPNESSCAPCRPMLYTAFLVAGVILTIRRFYFPDLR